MREITNIKEIQERLLEALISLSGICEQNGLQYWLCNGTLLGAEKYGGFIPWDDDVDICMPRKDYDRLMQLSLSEDSFRLLSVERYPTWRYPYAKYSCVGTAVSEDTADLGVEYGLSVDIFPVDSWAGSRIIANLQAIYGSLLCRFLMSSVTAEFASPRSGIQRGILFLVWKVSHMLGYERIGKMIRKNGSRRPINGLVQYMGSVLWCPYGKREVLPKEYFNESIEVSFEGHVMKAFCGAHEYLHRMYGDISLDPPPEKQKSNHPLKAWAIDQ